MAKRKIEFLVTKEFKKKYQSMPKEMQRKIDKQLKLLKTNPAHPSLKIHKLNDDWEFYVDIHYRCIFSIEKNTYKLKTLDYLSPKDYLLKKHNIFIQSIVT
jgi:mRNA-degrading endonuclease YafQ of YafQ-DinJ toxin-antitoxin module